ncbi:MAG: glycosyltransferase [Planctomycetes bacterium]|nr:glycosyltransferase [Planctomycetota bacterium]
MTAKVSEGKEMEKADSVRDLSCVAYLLQNFPKYSETFILNELLEHQRCGSSVRVLALRFPRDGRFHGCIAELDSAAEYVPESYWDKPDKRREATWEAIRQAPVGLFKAARRWVGWQADFRDLWQAILVKRWAARRSISHIHVHFGGYAARVAFLSRLMGGPSFSATLHAFDIFRDNVNTALLRDMIALSAFCVTVSEFNTRYLCDEVGADSTKVRVLYNGIPLSRFPFSEKPREPGVVLAVGRLIEKKGFVHLIRACGSLFEQGNLSRCDIVGEGPLKDELKAEISRLKLKGRVNLVGAWPQERVAEALGTASVFALPCVEAKDGNMDALPTVLLEAMAAGCPCVSTRLSGIPEIIEDGRTGRLVDPGDETGLTAAIRDVLKNREEAMRFSLASRSRAESMFDVRKAVGTLGSWLEQAANESRLAMTSSKPSAQRSTTINSPELAGEILA